jgi:nitronate monooxygenase
MPSTVSTPIGRGPRSNRAPFTAETCAIVEEFKPEVVGFHFGLPHEQLLARVQRAGSKVIASATTAREAKWLAEHGCDAIIAQGYEAGGHRGMFLTDNLATQVGRGRPQPWAASCPPRNSQGRWRAMRLSG